MNGVHTPPLLEVDGLTLKIAATDHAVVKDISFVVWPGEIVGIVGESGSGKTLAARSVIGLIPPPIRRTSGTIRFEGEDISSIAPNRLRKLRGARIGMVFQEPMTSLNPSMLLGEQLEEGLRLHRNLSNTERRRLILDMLQRVGLTSPEKALRSYPHQFSGGMRQRIMLASVMLVEPALLIADEPTTALDAVVQRDVLELMVALTREKRTAVLMISHDLGMVARYSHRVIVMSQGEIVEQGSTREIVAHPQHAYTRKLLAAIPRRLPARNIPSAPPLVSVRDLVVDYGGRRSFFRREAGKRALHGVSLDILPREVVAVVGGSGSGKTTLGQSIAGLVKPSGGEILFDGRPITKSETAYWDYRMNCQMVFQDPYSSLDPRMTVGQLVAEPLRHVADEMSQVQRRERVEEVLAEVGLAETFSGRFPHELSGGQRQRVAIARAIVRRPKFVIADEPVSALDVTIRGQILELFAELQSRHGFSCLFISHDLGVVEQVADRVIVMNDGQIVEQGTRDTIFDAPQHSYTRRLLSAVPVLKTSATGGVELIWRLEDEMAAVEQIAPENP